VDYNLTVYLHAGIIALEVIPMYSTKEAAQKLGLDESQVRRLLAKGEIKGKKWGRDWIVLDLSYERKRKPKTRRKLG
jgi:excisionase family DNA binding protein